jgi:hypothetical protein
MRIGGKSGNLIEGGELCQEMGNGLRMEQWGWCLGAPFMQLRSETERDNVR